MARMKDRRRFPPGEWQVLIPEAGMRTPFAGGFNDAVDFLLAFTKKNASMTQKLNLPTDRFSAENWVDSYNAQRMIAHGYTSFVEFDGSPADEAFMAQKKTLLGRRVVGAAGRVRSASAAYWDMFGPHGPVDPARAEARAAVCVGCPENNQDPGAFGRFTQVAANKIMGLLGTLRDLQYSTSHDEKLGVCDACDCPMRSKVFARIEVIAEHMPEDVWGKLPKENPTCWILREAGKL